jgi:hypothetical protein
MTLRRGATRFFGLLALAVALSSCASSSGERARTNSSILTREEMLGIQVANVFDAVERLRPRWLQIRTQLSLTGPTEIVVFMDRNYLGGPEVLRQFSPNDVARLRYMDGTTASATLAGMANRSVEAAIILEVSSP